MASPAAPARASKSMRDGRSAMALHTLDAEELPLQLVARLELAHRARPGDVALLEHVDTVGHGARERQVLLRKKHREALLLQLDDGIGHALDDQRRDTFGGLVEQHE